MAKKNTWKTIGRVAWELFKDSFGSTLTYLCTGTLLMIFTYDENALAWSSEKLTWIIICAAFAIGYNIFVAHTVGSTGYEMLVSGNLKRKMSTEEESFISPKNYAREYRPWKGWVMGIMTASITLILSLLCGRYQAYIDGKLYHKYAQVLVSAGAYLSGWSFLPMLYLNKSGVYISYYWGVALSLIPVLVTGIFYIRGAYTKRNKAIKAQEEADRQRKAEEEKRLNVRVNYGGLPGTKPKKKR